MAQTDRQTDKSTRWAMTVYEDQWALLDKMPELIAEWGWQEEKCPETGRVHRQGYFRTHRQVRFNQIKQVLPGIHVEIARNWSALLEYCKKAETSLGNTVHQISENKPMTMAESLIALAKYHMSDDQFNEMDDLKPKEKYIREYWYCVRKFLTETNKDNAIGLFTNNQMVLAWTRTRSHWITRHKTSLLSIEPNASQQNVCEQAGSQDHNDWHEQTRPQEELSCEDGQTDI